MDPKTRGQNQHRSTPTLSPSLPRPDHCLPQQQTVPLRNLRDLMLHLTANCHLTGILVVANKKHLNHVCVVCLPGLDRSEEIRVLGMPCKSRVCLSATHV